MVSTIQNTSGSETVELHYFVLPVINQTCCCHVCTRLDGYAGILLIREGLARYMLLSLEQRRKIYKRSIGELFYVSCDELQDLQYMEALIMVVKSL